MSVACVADGREAGSGSSQAEARVGHGRGQDQHAYHSAKYQCKSPVSLLVIIDTLARLDTI